ncbi:tumor necrosis factor receptor superfamily member 1A isoform X2 [Seriola aureovittata]|nr:tumor necrosis factor receptor superfamily member 1A isoform X2 [Seriola aureovittata]
MENKIEKCFRCDVCNRNEVIIKPCSITSNTKCDCIPGYYNAHRGQSSRFCMKCPCQNCQDSGDSKKKCQPCQRTECLSNSDCKRKCTPTTVSPATPTTTSTTHVTTRSNNASDIVVITLPPNTSNHWLWTFLVVVMVIFVVLFWFVLLFIWTQRNSCPYWSTNKGVKPHAKDPKLKEHRSHQDSSPTTLTINISEETPMVHLNYSPATPQHPADISPMLPNAVHKVAKQDEQSEHWPAIVLYAIIKEVPLRRWKEFLRLLSVADQQLERVELEAGLGLGSIERQYQMLRLWSQCSSASLDDVFSALHYMDLSGCAQLLQESLEKLQWRPQEKQGFTACRDFSASTQNT